MNNAKNRFKRYCLSITWAFCAMSLSSYTLAMSLEEVSVLTEEYPPYNYLDDQGRLKGIAVELLARAYKEAGISLDIENITVQPWPRSYRQLQRNTSTMLFSMTRNAQREKLFKWAGPISDTKVVLIAKKSNQIKIDSLEDLKKYTIGGILDDIGLQLVKELLKNPDKKQVVSVPTTASLTGMLAIDRINLWAYEENAAQFFLARNGFNPDDYETVYTLGEGLLYYAFSLHIDQKIVDRLQTAIDIVRANSD